MNPGAEFEVRPYLVKMAEALEVAPGATAVLEAPRTSILMAAVRVRTTGPVRVVVEERDGDLWRVAGETEAGVGTTVWHIRLGRPVFRLRLANPTGRPAVVSVDALLPCPAGRETGD
ncbi:MAG: hypothetical protein H5T97_12615 [Firmicutes bacterium]|nr:hypothetical protein [Bacillota bacterium]